MISNHIPIAAPVPVQTAGQHHYAVSVRALCDFTAKVGDLDLRFTPAPTALEGMVGHAIIASRRETGYQTEVTLHGQYRQLLIRGRADGYDPATNLLEEYKTYRGELHRIAANKRELHLAQLKVYGWLQCQKLGKSEIELGLVYYDITSQRETWLRDHYQASELQAFFESLCERFMHWAQQELAHRNRRNQALQSLKFPHAGFRPGQRELSEEVYKACTLRRPLLAQAPTGIGKTVATLFPLLKACPEQQLDKVFFLSAKNSGQQLALEALQLLAGDHLPLRSLQLVAKDRACEYPERACHGDACPLAKGFYDRLPAARQQAVALPMLDQAAVRQVALQHQVCPYYLTHDLAQWADVVIGDYNYYFDPTALLYSLTTAHQWQVAVLVDEAHNMVERMRSMYSASLSQHALESLLEAAPKALRKVLGMLHQRWMHVLRDQTQDYQVYPAIHDSFLVALNKTVSAISEYQNDHPATVHGELQQFFFDALWFVRLAEAFADHSLFDISMTISAMGLPDSVLCIRNVVPAPFLEDRYATARSVTLFSATLSPWQFYLDMLGLPVNTGLLDVASPFQADQLQVRVVRNLSTRFQHRADTLAPIAGLMASQFARAPGNYFAFVSSFDYLEQLLNVFTRLHPDIPVWQQSRRMGDADKAGFMQRFNIGGRGIGFAVLGGSFSEGIDLPGERLIGAFIATLGLPQVNPVNQQIMQRMAEIFDLGYQYTYLYPGLQKVVQAAGRVIRTPADRGFIYLLDDRFGSQEVHQLLPTWWKVDQVRYRASQVLSAATQN